MSDIVRLRILPLGQIVETDRGRRLDDVLLPLGFELPCGGAGTCGGCRIRVAEGDVAVTGSMHDVLSAAEIDAGWRLACQAKVESSATLEVAQWDSPVLSDDTPVAVEPQSGRIIVVDLGTTTIAAQLLDAGTGRVIALETALNPQRAFGADVMTRIEHAMSGDGTLTQVIQDCIQTMCSRLGPATEVLLCGNTVMQHLFCGAPVESLSQVPFKPVLNGAQCTLNGTFLPNLGGFVGSDALAGVIATRLYESEDLMALVDLGTNGEMVVGTRRRMLCASAAAGPAFEAGRIRMGMRAATGAIWRVRAVQGQLVCDVLGGAGAQGICGSGLVDAIAAGLELGRIAPSGRLNGPVLELAGPVTLVQSDIRELQLAKAAVAAGLRILTARLGASPQDLSVLYLAGAFGNYVNADSARRIGMLEAEAHRIVSAGNAALHGTKIIALTPSRRRFYTEELPARIEHISLASDPAFIDAFADCLSFPG